MKRRRRRRCASRSNQAGNGAAYWPASQSNMAAGVSASQSGMVLKKANPGHLLTEIALMSPWQVEGRFGEISSIFHFPARHL